MTTIPTRREEKRQDELMRAQIAREDAAARAQAARENAAARVKARATAKKAAADLRRTARSERAASVSAACSWLARHLMDLMFVPVITVPGALAWEAMAAYGQSLWGPLGVILPAFSEGAMWAFDVAVEVRRHREPGKPVWLLQLGIVVFAAYGAVLNFLHGLAHSTAHHGITTAVAMALVSVAGVTARQIITAPRMTHLERRAARKIRRAQRDAVDDATVDLSAPGGPQLVTASEPSPEAAEEPSEQPAAPPSPDGPKPVTVSVTKSLHGTLSLTFTPPVKAPSLGTVNPQVTKPIQAETDGPEKDAEDGPEKVRAKPSAHRGRGPRKQPGRYAKVDALITEGKLTTAAIASQARVSVSTVERRRRALRETGIASSVVVLDERRHA